MLSYYESPLKTIDSRPENLFEELCAWLKAYNKYPEQHDNPFLYCWVLTLRYRKKSGLLDDEMISKLNGIGFEWNIKNAEWESKAATVIGLLKNDQANFFSGRQAKLFRWLDENINSLHKENLPADRIPIVKEMETLLAASGLLPTIRGTAHRYKIECEWMANYNDILVFRKVNPFRWPQLNTKNKEERRLAKWCAEIRYQYKRNALISEWVCKMEAIGFNLGLNLKKEKH